MAKRKKKSTILITGASGFLGSHLVEVLHGQGHALRSLSRSFSTRLAAYDVDQYEGSVADREACAKAVEGVDAIYHVAGTVSRKRGEQGVMYAVHVQGTRNILDAALAAGIEDVLVVSTSGTVGVSDGPNFMATEDSDVPWSIIRNWPYYESKAYAEKEVAAYLARGLPVKMVRPTLLLGPGDLTQSSTGDVVRFLCGDVKATLPGGMSMVDVRDVAAIMPVVMERGEPGVGYLLSAGNMTIREWLVALADISGVSAPALNLPRKLTDRAGSILARLSTIKAFGGLEQQTFEMGCHYWYLDVGLAERALGWKPRSWQATLVDTVADLQGGRRD